MSTILAIESSCDDTSAAVIVDGVIKSNIITAQVDHRKYGGVVPELASRKHQVNILPVVQEALTVAGISKNDLKAIAFTRGPGLLGSLVVGVSFAKSLALGLDIPLIEVNHLQAHVLSHFIDAPKPSFPYLCLTVSGGHTQIVKVTDFLEMDILGTTIDDAAGEAFDKTGKILGLPYPAGPQIDKLAAQGTPQYTFAKPQIDGYDFSFSGLKTSILYFVRDQEKENPGFIKRNLSDICASVQKSIVDILMDKLIKAAYQEDIQQIAIAGGVSANSGLRRAVQEAAVEHDWDIFIPDFQYCTDNAGMIAIVGHYKYQQGLFSSQDITPAARLKM